jgi:hypothetical protein
LMNPDRTNLCDLGLPPGGNECATWSPDGYRLSSYTARPATFLSSTPTAPTPAESSAGPGATAQRLAAERPDRLRPLAERPSPAPGLVSIRPTAPGCKRCPGCMAPATHSTGSRLADPRSTPNRTDIEREPCSPWRDGKAADRSRGLPECRSTSA